MFAGSAFAGSVRVPPRIFFGVNFQDPYSLTSVVRDRHFDAIKATGLTEVRVPMSWQQLEPNPPTTAGHTYRWDLLDPVMASLAQRGLRAQPLIAYAPAWATNATPSQQTACRQNGAVGLAAGAPKQYADLTQAIAKRYGVNGSFWAANPGLPAQPLWMYEIWNAPNTAGAWCPRVDPEGYGIMFALAVDKIRQVDPNAYVVVGGVGYGAKTQNGSVATAEFLARMVRARPVIKTLPKIMVGIHMYPGKNLATQLNPQLSKFREWIRTAGFPDSVPMTVNEIGFTKVGSLAFTEPERVSSFRNVTSQIPRTNCNILGMLPYTWSTREQDHNNPEDWFGIAQKGTGNIYPSGQEYVHWADLFTGRLPQEAPRSTLMLCPGMPLPDVDNDGTPDQNDNFPLNPSSV